MHQGYASIWCENYRIYLNEYSHAIVDNFYNLEPKMLGEFLINKYKKIPFYVEGLHIGGLCESF
jgi:hypothetical protein